MEVTMRHCGSTLSDTYLSLLDASGNQITYNDDYSGTGACSNIRHSFLKRELDAGTYYVVSEGFSSNGAILTQISGTVVYVQGDNFNDPIIAGTFNGSFQYFNTQNTANFTNQYTVRSPNDVYYKFTLGKKTIVTITHCGSALDTYMSLLDASGSQITYNDDYSGDGACSSSSLHSFIQRTLNAGTYYVVSEGYSSSGIIITNITGSVSDEFDYPDIPNTYSSEPETVGSSGGTFNVSAIGGATYSIPIEVPQGVGGMQPSLSIVYNSQSGNGIVGWGGSLSGLSVITRAPKDIYHDGTAKGMTHLADETYYLDGQRLIYSSGTVGQEGAIYYPESDPFTKITVHGTYNTSTANTWFEVQTANGMTYYYGNTTSGRQSYTSGSSPRIHAWYLDYAEDPLGNYMTYTYNNWSYVMYPSSITYGNNKNESTGLLNTVTFSYEQRSNDAQPFVLEENVKGNMSTITGKTGNNVFRTYELQYDITSDGSATKFSRLTSVTEKNGAGEALKPVKLTWSYLPSFSQSNQTPSVQNTYIPLGVYGNNVSYSDQNYIAADINGDGLDDMIGIFPYENYSYYSSNRKTSSSTNVAFVNYASLNSSGNVQFTASAYYDIGVSFELKDWSEKKGSPSVLDYNGDGVNDLLVPNATITQNANYNAVEYKFIGGTMNNHTVTCPLRYSYEMPEYTTGDINNDGKGDVIFIEKGQNSGKYPCEIFGFNTGTTSYKGSFNFSLPSGPEKIFVSDYNGNGLQDILVFYNGGYTIFWNQGNGISSSTFSDSRKTTGTNIGNTWRIWTGDFNGDGLADFLQSASMDNKWYFALNNGNGTFTKQLACTLDLYDQDFTDRDDDKLNCFVYDFNGDGKSDVVILKAMYEKYWNLTGWHGRFLKTYTCWMRSTGTTLEQESLSTSNREEDAFQRRYVLGDFNGDGQLKLMNYGYNCYNSINADANPVWRMYRNSNFNTHTGKVTTITDGYGAATSISYASLANDSFYTKGTGSTYPVADYKIPVYAVKSVTASNGAAGSVTATYQYKGLKAHLWGKGLLGLTAQTVNNTTLGTVTESGIKSWDTSFYIPSETYTKTTAGGTTAETNVTQTIVNKGSKKYFAYPSTQTDKDLDGNTVTTTRQFNTSSGYMTEEKADFGNSMYKKTEYGSYIQAGKAYKPQLITLTQKHADDASAFTQKTSITYNTTKGYKEKVIENYGSSLPLTTDYTYDTFGNVKTSKVSGSGVTAPTNLYDYDATRRFVAKAYTSPASSVSSFTYDTWGNVLTEKDETNASNILATTHTYDNWGARKSTTLPDGSKMTFLSGWNNTPAKRYFTLTQGTGQPWVKTWYDNCGHEVLVETIGPKSVGMQQKTLYNAKGLVSQKQSVTGNLTATETYGYDERGRINSFSNSAGQSIAYTYGNRTATTVTNGRTYIKTTDAWGSVKSATDPATSISYTYKSLGKPQSITADNATFSMTYYDTGTQKTLTDPNAGTVTYEYDAAGRLKKQTDGRGKITVNQYDALGRLDYFTVDGETTDYVYGTSGYDMLRLIKKQTGNNYIAWSHNQYGRVATEIRQIDNTGMLSFGYGYNAKGEVETLSYPGGLTVTRQYDAYGNLQKVLAGTQVIWELTGETGTVTTTQMGNNTFTATQTRNAQGLLTNLKTMRGSAVLHDMGYNFNGATGNLNSRTGMTAQTESFLYDNLDRLQNVQQGGVTVMNTTYMPNGNIDTKTGLGEYKYESLPHAVSLVENTGGLLSSENQHIVYTAFNKISQITDKVGADNYLLDLVYGPDQQRWKSTLKKNNSTTKTIVFAGDYETITENGATKQLYYLSGNGGLAAVYIKQSGQTDKTYYVCKDHLGSIVKLTDISGTEVFKASYDAWGNRTVANNTFAFHRGYTGHEHLAEFGLINMNGRVYDPVLGRFLSPDPFVQVPDFSQSFNRYSYCLNNPFKYTDPDGEWNWLVAGIGFVYGYVNHGLTKGDWGWKALGNGALTGVMWGVGYTSGVAEAGITPLSYAAQSAVSSTVNSFMPSMSIPIGNSFSINASFGLGISPNGLVGGMNFSGTYHNGDFALTGGFGASGNMSSRGGGISYDDIGGSYYRTTFGNATGPDGKPNNQTVGGLDINIKDFSLRIENDLKIKGIGIEIGGDGGDRWRTSAVEVGIGNFVLGTSVYTNAPDGSLSNEHSRFWNRTKRAYADGRVFSSPLYIGYKQGGRVTRIGLNQPWVQDATQNSIHLYLSKSSPLFPTPYQGHPDYYSSAYRYSGYYNPYSLYYR